MEILVLERTAGEAGGCSSLGRQCRSDLRSGGSTQNDTGFCEQRAGEDREVSCELMATVSMRGTYLL